MKNRLIKIFAVLIISATFMGGCDILQQMATFTKCQFKMNSMTDTRLAGVDVQSKTSLKSLSFIDVANLTKTFMNGKLPLTFNLNIEVKNPNTSTAAMQQMAWRVFIDDVEMTAGVMDKVISIDPNGSQILPLAISVDLKEVLKGKSKDALLNFGLNLVGAGNYPTRVKLDIQPTITVGSIPITYPGYFTVQKNFGAGEVPAQQP